MNILLDFITFQLRTGAVEYARRVMIELLERCGNGAVGEHRLFAVWDSSKGIAYDDMQVEKIAVKYGVVFSDCHETDIKTIVQKNRIDRFFIACGQLVGVYKEVAELDCEVFFVIHDAHAEELLENHIYEFMQLSTQAYDYQHKFQWHFLNQLRHRWHSWLFYKWFAGFRHGEKSVDWSESIPVFYELMQKNPQTHMITDSNYSKSSLMYHWDIAEERITVLYPPERLYAEGNDVVDEKLHSLVSSGQPYFLMLGAHYPSKNANKAITAFERYAKFHGDCLFLVVGKKNSYKCGNVLRLPYLSDSDLQVAMKHCRAFVYPSLFEGFGYPPVEVMKYGKPVLCSNVTSVPEILGDAPIYFSPFYNSDIFRAMMALTEEECRFRSRKSIERYRIVHERQERDLQKLVAMILGDGAPSSCQVKTKPE